MNRIELEKRILLACEEAEETINDKQVVDAMVSALATYVETRGLNKGVVTKTFSCYHRMATEAPMA
jgi:hypothetical protein